MTEQLALPKGLGRNQIAALERALDHDGGTLVMADGFIGWSEEGPTSDTLAHRLAYLIGSTIDICDDNATETLYCSWVDRQAERATAAALRRVWERMGQPAELLTSEGLRSARAALIPSEPSEPSEPARCTYFGCATVQGPARFATHSVVWPSEPWLTDGLVCDVHAASISAILDGSVCSLVALPAAPPVYDPALVPPPPPAEFRWFATCPDGLSRCDAEGYASHAEAAHWAGWGHGCLSVTEHRIYAAPAVIPEADRVFWAPPPAQPSEPAALPPAQGFGLPTTLKPITWECENDEGATFSLTFSDGAEEQTIHAWWIKRHDFCRPCAECRHCHHPDHENYCPADGSRWGF